MRTDDLGRSHDPITAEDLGRLSSIAAEDRARFNAGRPEYRDRLLCVALCQGAGLHFIDAARGRSHTTGIKDFDVWSFYAAIPDQRFPADRRMTHADFGPSHFGHWPDEPPQYAHYRGRRVDLLLRALRAEPDADPASTLRDYLREGRTKSSQALATKGVVLIDPASHRGEIVWPQ